MPQPAVILTGASGFVGRHLLAELKDNFRVFAIARRSQRECGAPVDPNIAWMQVDVGDKEELGRTFREISSAGGARYLIHLAAYYDFTGDRHPEYRRTNVEGTRNVLDLARGMPLDRLIFASSVAACHFPRKEGPVGEITPPDGRHVYAWSKREGERMVRECREVPSCIVRFGAVFSDWCEYPPLYVFMRTWLGGSPRSRILPGSGRMAIPYIHVRDAVRFLQRLIDVNDRLQHAETVIASTPGSTAIGDLYDLATRYYFGRPKPAIHLPALICGAGLHLTDLLGRAVGQRPFERPWMYAYINRRLEVDNSRTCSLMEWSPLARHHIERRFPLMIERLRSEPMEWRARNDAAMRRETGRPSLHIYKALIAIEEEVIDGMVRALESREEGELLPHYRNLGSSEFKWILRLLYRLLLTSIQTSNRLLILNYLEVTCADRFRAGFAAEEIRHLLRLLNGTILSILDGRPELRGLGQALYDQVTVPFELGMDEVREQYDRLREGEAGLTESRAGFTVGSPSPRETLEQTIWKCLVQRK